MLGGAHIQGASWIRVPHHISLAMQGGRPGGWEQAISGWGLPSPSSRPSAHGMHRELASRFLPTAESQPWCPLSLPSTG